jgi:phosphate transport system substrate-binding protein
MDRKHFFTILLSAAAFGLGVPAAAIDITGAGATFPYPIYAKWADAYKRKTGVGLNYQSIGSGGGIAQIKAKTVDFGASDMPLKPDELQQAGLMQFPAIIGGVVPVVNLEGIAPGQLKFTGPVLADIFLGKIKIWNDKAIADLNPGLKLPADPITVVRRSDGSGTTFIWTDYLSKVSPEWKEKVGASTAVAWPEGVGGKGNEGVAAYVQRIKGSIGYVEYAYAKKNKMSYASVRNKRPIRAAGRRDLSGRCRVRRLEECAGLLSDSYRPARKDKLADHRRELHPDAPETGKAAERRRSTEILRLGAEERSEDGSRARLRADARQRDQGHRRRVAHPAQGRFRQASLELVEAAAGLATRKRPHATRRIPAANPRPAHFQAREVS